MSEPGGFIYALRSGDLIKIGFSKNPQRRTRGLTTASPSPCKYLGYKAGSRYDEGDLHQQFQPYRAHGEWFRAEGLVLEFVKTLRPARDFLFSTDKRRMPRTPEMQARINTMSAAKRAARHAERAEAYRKYAEAAARKSAAAQ